MTDRSRAHRETPSSRIPRADHQTSARPRFRVAECRGLRHCVPARPGPVPFGNRRGHTRDADRSPIGIDSTPFRRPPLRRRLWPVRTVKTRRLVPTQAVVPTVFDLASFASWGSSSEQAFKGPRRQFCASRAAIRSPVLEQILAARTSLPKLPGPSRARLRAARRGKFAVSKLKPNP